MFLLNSGLCIIDKFYELKLTVYYLYSISVTHALSHTPLLPLPLQTCGCGDGLSFLIAAAVSQSHTQSNNCWLALNSSNSSYGVAAAQSCSLIQFHCFIIAPIWQDTFHKLIINPQPRKILKQYHQSWKNNLKHSQKLHVRI